MTSSLAVKGRQLAGKTLKFQSIVALVIVVIFTITMGNNAGLAALLGALASLVPSFVFARLAFRYAGASQNEQVVRSFSQGSKLKLLLTIIIFVLAFYGLEAQPMPLFIAFAGTTVTQWVAMLMLRSQE